MSPSSEMQISKGKLSPGNLWRRIGFGEKIKKSRETRSIDSRFTMNYKRFLYLLKAIQKFEKALPTRKPSPSDFHSVQGKTVCSAGFAFETNKPVIFAFSSKEQDGSDAACRPTRDAIWAGLVGPPDTRRDFILMRPKHPEEPMIREHQLPERGPAFPWRGEKAVLLHGPVRAPVILAFRDLAAAEWLAKARARLTLRGEASTSHRTSSGKLTYEPCKRPYLSRNSWPLCHA